MAAMKVLRFIARALAWIAGVLCAAWAFGALFFDFPVVTLRAPAAIVFVLVLLVVVIFVRGRAEQRSRVAVGCCTDGLGRD